MKALVCEGGGFKTAFTTGVLDAWLCAGYYPFDIFLGVSGGAVVMSSYIAQQYKRGWELVSSLQADSSLTSFSRFVKGGYFLELDLIEHIWDRITPFDQKKADWVIQKKIVEFSCTHLNTGEAVYIRPDKNGDWKKYLRATSTLPIVSQCPHVLNGLNLVDGAFAAPVPVQRAIELGATDIIVIRTNIADNTMGSRWSKLMSNYLLKTNYPAINQLMQEEEKVYAEISELIFNPPNGIKIQAIVPRKIKSTVLNSSPKYLKRDYLRGLEQGMDFLNA
jgi:predicted patatin/cPLA2 family phospholipase